MFKHIVLAAWLAIAAAAPAFATSVKELDLAQIVDDAPIAFQGSVVDTSTGRDPRTGMIVTLTTFRVDDVLKGDVAGTYTIKQIGGVDAAAGIGYKAYGVPTFTKGSSYVVFMTSVSSIGFSNPIGLSQGRFAIEDSGEGLEVGNGRDFTELAANMRGVELPAAAKAKAAAGKPVMRMNLADFKAMVRKHAGSKQ